MDVLCLDLEGVLIPEIWIGVAERTGIEALGKTTRDIPVYDDLMQLRLGILDAQRIDLATIRAVIDTLEPLPGAMNFLQWARARFQVAIVFSPTPLHNLRSDGEAPSRWPILLCKARGGYRRSNRRLSDSSNRTQSGLICQNLSSHRVFGCRDPATRTTTFRCSIQLRRTWGQLHLALSVFGGVRAAAASAPGVIGVQGCFVAKIPPAPGSRRPSSRSADIRSRPAPLSAWSTSFRYAANRNGSARASHIGHRRSG
jgi:hypothetical protein